MLKYTELTKKPKVVTPIRCLNKVGRKGIDCVGVGVWVDQRAPAEPVVCRRFALDPRVLPRLCDATEPPPSLGIRSRPFSFVLWVSMLSRSRPFLPTNRYPRCIPTAVSSVYSLPLCVVDGYVIRRSVDLSPTRCSAFSLPPFPSSSSSLSVVPVLVGPVFVALAVSSSSVDAFDISTS